MFYAMMIFCHALIALFCGTNDIFLLKISIQPSMKHLQKLTRSSPCVLYIQFDFVRHNTCHFCHKHIPNTPFLIKLKFATHTFFCVSILWHGYTLLMLGTHHTLYS